MEALNKQKFCGGPGGGFSKAPPGRRRLMIEFFKENFSPCCLCPRQCRAEREKNKQGVCGAVKEVKLASYNLHYGEEPPVSGTRGSGTVFFSGCPMKCVFCQNYPISHLFNGRFYSIEELADIFLNLQERGAHNINFVSPTPYLYHIVRALPIAWRKGLEIPIVYNTSGYERPEIIKALNHVVDVYMPDLKYHDNSLSPTFSEVNDYFEHAYPAIEEMFKQAGELQVDEAGIARKGMILRHLILPGQVENSKKVLKIISQSSFKNASLSLMSQYFPAYQAAKIPGINRRVQPEEYEDVKNYALSLNLTNGWFQEL
jgi:putative pyruvate formate lyase activating enzyme